MLAKRLQILLLYIKMLISA